MLKDVQMSFRIEPELRADFVEAAMAEDRPAAQVLREFMRAYVTQSRQHKAAHDQSLITPDESRERLAAVNFSRASLGLEGFKPHPEDEKLYRRYVAGEINMSDVIKEIDAYFDER